jgi:membrane protein
MKLTLKDWWKITKQSFSDFSENKTFRLSAALAYYTLFSIGPLLLVVIALCDVFYGKKAIEGNIYHQIEEFVGSSAALQIQEILKNAAISKGFNWASVIGGVSLVIGATTVFSEIQDSINLIWHLKAKPKKGWLKIIIDRLLSFSMVISLGFLLLVSLLINAVVDAIGKGLLRSLPDATVYVAYTLNSMITFTIIASLFAIIFKVLPDAKIKWRDVAVGSVVTSLLFMLGKFVLGLYLGSGRISNAYGAAGSLILILLWVYYSAVILYFGAAFTRVYSQCRGRNIYPTIYAVWIKQVEIENKESLQEQDVEKKTYL